MSPRLATAQFNLKTQTIQASEKKTRKTDKQKVCIKNLLQALFHGIKNAIKIAKYSSDCQKIAVIDQLRPIAIKFKYWAS